eukprot:9153427-Pyramimonas_sp.AAC.1
MYPRGGSLRDGVVGWFWLTRTQHSRGFAMLKPQEWRSGATWDCLDALVMLIRGADVSGSVVERLRVFRRFPSNWAFPAVQTNPRRAPCTGNLERGILETSLMEPW